MDKRLLTVVSDIHGLQVVWRTAMTTPEPTQAHMTTAWKIVDAFRARAPVVMASIGEDNWRRLANQIALALAHAKGDVMEPTPEQRELTDPARSIAKMFSKMDEEDKDAFNFCMEYARGEQHAGEEVTAARIVERTRLYEMKQERDAALRLASEDAAAIRWLLERVAEWTWLTTIQGDGGLVVPPEHVKAIERAGGHVHVA